METNREGWTTGHCTVTHHKLYVSFIIQRMILSRYHSQSIVSLFRYCRSMRVDSGGEHLFQLGTIRVSNLLPDSPFPDTLDRDSR